MNYLCSDFTLNLQWYVAGEKWTDTHNILSSFQKINGNNICNMLTDRTLGFEEKSDNKVLN